jgi:hypothetical protein
MVELGLIDGTTNEVVMGTVVGVEESLGTFREVAVTTGVVLGGACPETTASVTAGMFLIARERSWGSGVEDGVAIH